MKITEEYTESGDIVLIELNDKYQPDPNGVIHLFQMLKNLKTKYQTSIFIIDWHKVIYKLSTSNAMALIGQKQKILPGK